MADEFNAVDELLKAEEKANKVICVFSSDLFSKKKKIAALQEVRLHFKKSVPKGFFHPF